MNTRRRSLLYAVMWTVITVAVGVVLVVAVRPARAAEYTSEDVITAIDEASAETGVSWTWLYRTVHCETGGTFNAASVGRQGELGAAQLHPRGRLPHFYATGYTDPFDPAQAVRYMALEFKAGRWRAWSCA